MKKIKAWIKLLETPEIGIAKAIKLTENLGEPINFIGSSADKLQDIDFISEVTKRNLASNVFPKDWNRIAILLEKFNIKFISI